jgi:filamentous hemagglutinin family protein
MVEKTKALKCGVSLAVLMFSAGSACAGALPGNGHYVAGQGAIAKAAQSLTVKQSSTTGIIDWNSFSIGADRHVTFDNGSGATLNRVTGGNLSRIAGSLHATGSLYLLNSQGVIVSGTGRVVTGGNFVASTASDDASGSDDRSRLLNAKAAVVNRGTIVARGEVALIGTGARNTGAITAADVKLLATTGEALAGGTIRAGGKAANAGHIRVVSVSGRTSVAGDLFARGAKGAGGTIETSGARMFVAGSVDAGRGGHWLIDPENLTVNSTSATTIDHSLDDGTSVKLKTTSTSASGPGTKTSGAGDIIIGAALKWTTGATLTLDAYHSLVIKRAIEATDAGGLSLTYGHGGRMIFEGGHVTFDNLSSALSIKGNDYTLVSTLSQLGTDAGNNSDGFYALANSINAKSLGTLGSSPVVDEIPFGGIIEGLGNTISNLTIKDNDEQDVGLVADNASGIVRDINLSNISITANTTLGGDNVGGLVGYNGGTVFGSSVSGKINGATESSTGGLVGINWGAVEYSFSTAAVSTPGGGSGASVGGLVGEDEALISTSYATGNVTGGSGDIVGGLAGGVDNQDDISVSIENSYATGNVKGSNSTIGGLGGLIGLSQDASHIEFAYSTGTVTGTNSNIGGVVGTDDQDGSFKDVYWDTSTSGIGTSHGAGNVTHDKGIAGESTFALSKALPSGFGSSSWAESSSINGGLPYLTALAWSY